LRSESAKDCHLRTLLSKATPKTFASGWRAGCTTQEARPFQDGYVAEEIAVDGDDVGALAELDGADPIGNAEEVGGV
jgi:hypothetical protein